MSVVSVTLLNATPEQLAQIQAIMGQPAQVDLPLPPAGWDKIEADEPPIVAEVPLPPIDVSQSLLDILKGLAANGDVKLNCKLSPFPLIKVRTVKGTRGVMWVGYKPHKETGEPELRVGTIKLTKAGRCFQFGKYAGMFYQPAAELAANNPPAIIAELNPGR